MRVKYIIRKELLSIVRDKRILVTMFMPLVIFPILYLIMGQQTEKSNDILEEQIPVLVHCDLDQEEEQRLIDDVLSGFELIRYENTEEKSVEDLLLAEEILVALTLRKQQEGYCVEILYNSYANASSIVAQIFSEIYQTYRLQMYALTLNALECPVENISEITTNNINKNDSSMLLLIPMLLSMFLFSGISGVSVDMFAGEKERGTWESLVSTQTGRSVILCGKVISVALVGLIHALLSVSGYALAMYLCSQFFENMNVSLSFSAQSICWMGLLLLSLACLSSLLFSIISLSSQTIKEAHSVSTFLTLVPSLLSSVLLCSPSNQLKQTDMWIPIYNSFALLKGILTESTEIRKNIFVIAYNLIITILLLFVGSKMIKKEKYLLKK